VNIFEGFYWQFGQQLYTAMHGDARTAITILLPYLLSISTVIGVLRQGNKDNLGWYIMLANQSVWLAWILLSGSYGFLLMNIVLWFVSIRNILLWRKASKK
jgi:hypothetical protein